ncbi:MAG: DUF3307 domain-containing protein [Salinivirgaceae bacterium]|nr:DUF3307 domain-containing protein [Salinivirgaceae bacterium]
MLCNLLGDFIFQPHSWTFKKKTKAITWYHLWHTMVIFMFSYLLSFDYGFLKCAILLTLLHFTTDVLKSYFQLKFRRKESLYFFTDQIIHLTLMIIISFTYYYHCGVDFLYDIPIKYIAIAAGFIFCAKPSNILIKNIFNYLEISIPTIEGSKDDNKDIPNAGKLIGLMERFLVLALILVGQYSAVGLIIAAKSILRFRDNKKNEYVLVGTLLSFGIATILGILISLI